MEQSPLTQQSRPEIFKPKVVYLYETLFAQVRPAEPFHEWSPLETDIGQSDDDTHEHEISEGFWQELFLLKPNPPGLQRVLAALSAEDLIHLQVSYHRPIERQS